MSKVQEYYLRFVIITDWVNNKNTIFSDSPINVPSPISKKIKEIYKESDTYISEYKLQYYDYNEAQKLSSIPPPLPKRNKKILLPEQMAPKLPRRKFVLEKEDYLPDMTPPPLIRKNNGFRVKQKPQSSQNSKNGKTTEVKCDVIAYI